MIASTTVQGYALQNQGIHTETQRPGGEARGEIEHEPLGPLLGSTLSGRARLVAIIVIEVQVAQGQSGMAAFDEVCARCLADGADQGAQEQACQA
ncbi:hypothetical protein D3C76_1273840 [compost metagenome]